MIANAIVLDRVEKVARALGPDLGEVVFVGGAALAIYGTRRELEARPTEDVDLVVTMRRAAYYDLVARLVVRGFRNCIQEGAPVCRYELDGVLVDVMPDDPAILGFSNRWYREAMADAETWLLPGGMTVRALRPIDFIATKLDAFDSRGAGDYLASKDLEDVVTLLVAMPELLDRSPEPSAAGVHVRRRLAELVDGGRLLECLEFHLPGTPQGEEQRLALAAGLRALAEAERAR